MPQASRTDTRATRNVFHQIGVGVIMALTLAWPHQVLAQAPAGQVVEYYHLDALGSVRVVTDQAGQVIDRHDFLPFGDEYPGPQPAAKEKKLFTGHEHDAETGLDYFGARYYEAPTGRFTTVDPFQTTSANLLDPQRWNRYAYARNNPLRWLDPDGRDTADPETPEQLTAQIPKKIRSEMATAIAESDKPTSDDKKGGSHEESGVAGIDGDRKWVVSRDLPGKYVDIDSGTTKVSTSGKAADQDLANSIVDPRVEFHVHPSAKSSAGAVWAQEPSPGDKANANPGLIHIVFGARDKMVYFYNSSGQIGKAMKLDDFLRK